MKTKIIPIPIFRGQLIFEKGKTFKRVNKKYGYNIPEKWGAVTFVDEKADGFKCVVAFVDSYNGLLAHEAIHVSNYIFKNVGIKIDTDNDETQAYMVGWIVEEMDKFLNNTKK